MRRALAGALAALALGSGGWYHLAPANPDAPNASITVYEDGSGVQYAGDQEVRTFPEGTFVWDCRRMGNRRCGKGVHAR